VYCPALDVEITTEAGGKTQLSVIKGRWLRPTIALNFVIGLIKDQVRTSP